MGLARAWSVALYGVDGVVVEIEADVGAGTVKTQLLGLPDAALHESKDRVKAAIRNSAHDWPTQRVTLGLSPAALPKGGAGYDLALASVVLAAARAVPPERLEHTVLLGELALDGRLRGVRGTLPALLAAYRVGLREAVVPVESLAEASLVEGLRIHGANTLTEVVAWLRGDDKALQPAPKPESPARPVTSDLADVVGQPEARWALEVAAAGAHHLLFSGPPGTGKTMLAQRLSGLLPPLTTAEALEVTAIHSVAGLLSAEAPLVTAPPLIALHHSATTAALVGGGTGLAKPGSASKAHRGVLFLDEACEFNRTGLDALRTAIEEGEIRLARQGGTVRYPARFQLVMATNTCPCAPPKEVDCTCTPRDRRRYMAKLSGPLLDRVDLRVKMRPLIAMNGAEAGTPEPTSVVRERVLKARTRATERWTTRNQSWRTNAEVPGPALRREFALPRQVTALLDRALSTGALTGRGADRCIRVAWTLADLAETDRPTAEHVAAALEFRERRYS